MSPEIIGGKDLYFESTKPHLLKLTVKHELDDIAEEYEIITKHKCTLETIGYHLPGIETPLVREIKINSDNEGTEYINYLNSNPKQKQTLENLYKSVNGIHSHLITGPDIATFEKLIKDLEKKEEIIGINLTNAEIAEITGENI